MWKLRSTIGAWIAPASALAIAGWCGERDEPPVELPVERHDRVEVLVGAGGADVEHGLRQLVERGDVGRGRVGHGERGEPGFERGPQIEHALQLGDGPARHPRAPVRDDLDEALGGEPAERLADGGAADAEPLGQLDLAEAGARRELPVQDQLADGGDRPTRRGLCTQTLCAK